MNAPFLKLAKKIYRYYSAKYYPFKKSISCKTAWYGSTYGGFFACPDLIHNNSIVYSFGIGNDISFDKAIIDKHACKVFGFDPTPKSIEWISKQPLPPDFNFQPYGIGLQTESVYFFLPKKPTHISGSILNNSNTDSENKILVPLKKFSDILSDLHHSTIDVLKMDIEGTEYDVLADILKSSAVIKQILIEFHYRLVENGFEKTKNTVDLLKSHGFEVFAISETYEEISFINKTMLNNSNNGHVI